MKKFVSNLIAILLTVMAANVAAQVETWSVSGRIIEKNNNRPVSGVTVGVRELSTLRAITDTEGRYTLTLPSQGLYTLFVSTSGFDTPAPISIALNESASKSVVDFHLLPIVRLAEVFIEAERSPDKISKNVLSFEELRYAPGTMGDPLRALQSLPGVAMGSDFSSAPAIRGSGPDNNFYYYDTLPVGQLFHVDGTSVFHPNLIRDFNLYSGVFGPHYADVIGGILDVSLSEPSTDKLGAIIGVSLFSSSLLIEGPVTDNQSFYLAARRSFFDVLLSKVKVNGASLPLPSYHDYQGRYLWNINTNHKLSLYFNGARDGLIFAIPADDVKSEPVFAGDFVTQSNYATQALMLDSIFSGGAYNKLAVGNTGGSQLQKVGSALDLNIGDETKFLREQFFFEPIKNHDVMLSANIESIRADVNLDVLVPNCTQFEPQCDYTSARRVTFNRNVAFKPWDMSVRDRWLVLPSLTLIGGVRQSHDTFQQQIYTEPRLGMEWAYTGNTTLTAAWGKHNQRAQFPQIMQDLGNPNLRHILSEQSVLGISQKYTEDWSLKTEAYYKKISNLVVADDTTIYANGGSGRNYGVELLLKKARTDKLSGWFSLTLAKAEVRNDLTGERINFSFNQPVNATVVGNYKFNSDWLLGSRWTVHSGNPYTPVIGTEAQPRADGRHIPIYAPLNSERLPLYHRLDFRLDRFHKTRLGIVNWYLEILNVYNQENIAGYTYSPDYSKKTPIPQFPVFPNLGVELAF